MVGFKIGWLLFVFLLPLATVEAGWSLEVRAQDPPPAVADAVAAERSSDPQSQRRSLRWHALGHRPQQPVVPDFLVFVRDRGQRIWILDLEGNVLTRIPRGAAAADEQIGTRGLTVPLEMPGAVEQRRWLAIESSLGTFPQPQVESLPAFLAAERTDWVYDAGFSSVLVALVLLSLAFLFPLRDRMYLAYALYLALMLAALWLRHPVAFRSATAFGIEPERIAALGVLAAALAAWAALELLLAGSGIGRRNPRSARFARLLAMAAIALGVVDLLSIVAMPALAHASFVAINALFGTSALFIATLLVNAALRGGRMPGTFLAGWMVLVVLAAWFSLGPLLGIPQPEDPHRYILAGCALQGLIWAVALADRALRLQRERDLAQALAENDPLTGLPNRRALDRHMDSARSGVLVLCDLDRFKAINDRFGHAAGDFCLQHFGRLLETYLGAHGMVGRYGGEEFLAIASTDSDTATAASERLREATERMTVDLGGVRIVLTVSIGLARFAASDAAAALVAADRALYRAKAEGRNRIAAAEG